MLIGKNGMEKLARAHVAVFGIGGVGGYVAETLIRAGVGHMDLVDPDKFVLSNLNRQIFATHETVGQYKVDAAASRLAAINPDAEIRRFRTFYLPENQNEFDFSTYDYIVDAVDTVSAKIALAVNAERTGTPIISSMGAGNKTDPTGFRVADLYETSVCPLARVMRRELKKRGVRHLKVVYSTETPLTPGPCSEESRKPVAGTTPFVPAAAGIVLASEVFRDLICGGSNGTRS